MLMIETAMVRGTGGGEPAGEGMRDHGPTLPWSSAAPYSTLQ